MTTSSDSAHRRIAIAGATGRMGRMLIQAVTQAADTRLSGALDIPGNPQLGADAAAFLGQPAGVLITSDMKVGLQHAQVLIDFTRPEGSMQHLAMCRQLGVQMVIGTTGFSDAQKAEINAASRDIGIVMAPNMSVGVNVTLKLLQMAAKALSDGYDIEIIEAHHKHSMRPLALH